jgi:hypothetical protein
MTQNPRPPLLHRARRRTAAIVIGTLAGTGVLTAALAASAQQATVSEPTGSTGTTTRQGTGSADTSGSSSSGVGSSTSSGSSQGGSSSS